MIHVEFRPRRAQDGDIPKFKFEALDMKEACEKISTHCREKYGLDLIIKEVHGNERT